ncbi:uncharacterized protein LOC114730947 [Neltuma alba]|uniref:uncharacterized protein LOC114730947 n=1 Tax=Neltuma alba TaxID=207710 RepID=UPI0010A4696A|nr:uncharacterized protein LOC114730947 [Prosopis alba]
MVWMGKAEIGTCDQMLADWLKWNSKNCPGRGVYRKHNWIKVFSLGCWTLWTSRCKLVFEGKTDTPRELGYRVQHLLMEQIVGDQLKHQIFQFAGNQEISWTPPPQGAIRIDVDGSVWNDQHAACGGLTRNSDGDWVVGFQKNIGTCSVTEAELVAIRTGLEVGKLYNHPMVVLYSDSMDALNLIARECMAHMEEK